MTIIHTPSTSTTAVTYHHQWPHNLWYRFSAPLPTEQRADVHEITVSSAEPEKGWSNTGHKLNHSQSGMISGRSECRAKPEHAAQTLAEWQKGIVEMAESGLSHRNNFLPGPHNLMVLSWSEDPASVVISLVTKWYYEPNVDLICSILYTSHNIMLWGGDTEQQKLLTWTSLLFVAWEED